MSTITATETKNRFGRVLSQAAKEPVTIEKSGRPVAVIMSYEMFEHYQALEDYHWRERARGIRKQGEYAKGPAIPEKIQERFDEE